MRTQNSSLLLPEILKPNPTFQIIEFDDLRTAMKEATFGPDLQDQFAAALQTGGIIRLVRSVQEPEYGLYTQDAESLKAAPEILAGNINTTLDKSAHRNFQYVTFSLAHKNPAHPLNTDYIAQWRIHLDVKERGIAVGSIKFCVKSRNKNAPSRDEWEENVKNFSQQEGFSAIADKYDEALPKFLRQDHEDLANAMFVTSVNPVSRSGYNGIQTRRKWGVEVLHKFSHDVQLAASPALLPLAWRYEFEDEAEGFGLKGVFGNIRGAQRDFQSIINGALDVHKARLIQEYMKAGKPLQRSSLSKAAFGESSTLGKFDKSSSLHKHNQTPHALNMGHIRDMDLQVNDYFTHQSLLMGLALLLQQLPEKGSAFPQDFDRDRYAPPADSAVT